jgi:hypothetical protein
VISDKEFERGIEAGKNRFLQPDLQGELISNTLTIPIQSD